MKRISQVGFFAAIFLAAGVANAGKYEDTISLFKNAGESAAFFKNSYAYAVFPNIGEGGFIVGGAYGQGEVYHQGKRVGYADMTQATVGASIGGQTYSELIVFRTPQALQNFESGQYTFSADVSGVAAKAGAADNARWENDIAVFADVKGGLMADASVGGQKFNFEGE